MAGAGDVSIIRRAIERHLSPSQTSLVLFEALSEHGSDVPQTERELLALVRGPLVRALSKHLGEAEAQKVGRRIEDELDDAPEIVVEEMPLAPLGARAARGREATAAVPTARAAVCVAVIAAGRGFAGRLSAVLGPRRVAPRALASAAELTELSPAPPIALVDATDFAAIEPAELASALGRLPATTARVVWGSELPYGASLLAAMRDAGIPSMPLSRHEGIEPLLDLVRSRRAVD